MLSVQILLLTLTSRLCAPNTMAISRVDLWKVSTFACHLLCQLVNARPSPGACNSSTAIDGNVFPPLIEATMEDLIRGYESSWFTSVDVVQVLFWFLQIGSFANRPRLTFRESWRSMKRCMW